MKGQQQSRFLGGVSVISSSWRGCWGGTPFRGFLGDRGLFRSLVYWLEWLAGTLAPPRKGFSFFLLVSLGFICLGTPSARAESKEFLLPNGPVLLTSDRGSIEIYFRNIRYNRLADEWNTEIELENLSFRQVAGPIVVSIAGGKESIEIISPDGIDSSGTPFIVFDKQLDGGALRAGERSASYTIRIRSAADKVPELSVTVFFQSVERDYGLAVVQTMDGDGQLLPAVQVMEFKEGEGGRALASDNRLGWLTLGNGEGSYQWKFEKPGYLPVWRQKLLTRGDVAILESPMLTFRSTESFRLSPLNGANHQSSDGSISILFPSAAFSELGSGRLTPLSAQALPARLPSGWSPIQAFWLELDIPSTRDGEVSLISREGVEENESALLVRWNDDVLVWEVISISPGAGTAALVFPVTNQGAYSVVVADRGGSVPLVPEVGGILGSTMGVFSGLEGITAAGEVTPAVAAASTDPQLVTAEARVTFQHPTETLVSGMQFICEVSEVYHLADGSIRRTPVYERSLIAFQRPGGSLTGSLQAVFPMRPQLLIGPDELVDATVTVDIKLPNPFEGTVVGAEGGRVALGNGMSLEVRPGLFDAFEAIRIRALEQDDFSHFGDENLEVVGAFELAMSQGDDTRGLSLIAVPRSEGDDFVLARVVSRSGVYGIEPVERLSKSEGNRLLSMEPNRGVRLSGVDRSGQYILLRVTESQSLLSGTTTNAEGLPQDGMIARLGPWSTLSESDGFYRLLAPLGPNSLRVLDAVTGDTAVATVEIVEAGSTLTLQTAATGPIVVGVDPAAGSERVSTISAVTITFSESVNPLTVLNGGVDLIDSNDLSVPVSLSLNSRNNEVILFPVDPLLPDALYRTRLQQTITDSAGLRLEGETEFQFTTVLPSTRGQGGQLIVYQPGARALPEEVERNLVGYDPEANPFVVAVQGTQGSADPEVPVVVSNESTGATSTVLSKVDGSFYTFIDGTEDDFVSATYVNQNGSRVYLPVSRQEFDNGFVGLYQQGGILEAESDGGAVQVLVEPGSIDDKSKLGLQTVDLFKLLDLLKGVQPEGGGQVLGGMVLSVEGDETPDTRAELSFEVKPEALPLDPGVAPEDATWGLAIPREYDGVITYEIIDSMQYIDGRLVTQGMASKLDPTESIQARGLRRQRSATVTPGGIVSEQLRPPISIGILFDAISAAQKGSRRASSLDLSDTILNALGLPGIGEVLRHQLMLPIMMAQGTSVGIGGIVKAITVDEQGQISDSDDGDALVGALIMVDQGPVTRRPGKLRPGIMYASSNERGEYAFNVPVTLDVSGFILTATHPRYPFQVAKGGATIGSLADRFGFGNFANVPLFFAKGDFFDAGQTGDSVKPLIRAAHDPPLPAPGGTDESDGVVLSVVGIDNGTMATVNVVKKKAINLSTGAEEDLATVTIEEVANAGAEDTTTQSNSLTKRFRIKSERRARVTLELSAVDGAGLSTEVPYLVTFGGNRPQITPEDPSDEQGPRILFSWPPEGAPAVQPGTPIVLRFSESVAESNFGDAVANWLTFESHEVISAQASPDFKEVEVFYSGPAGDAVKLSISSSLADRNGKAFDQNPDEDGDQAFNLEFQLASGTNVNLPEAPVSGGGVVFHGAYAFAIEREGEQDGAVFAYDLSDPDSPERVGSLSVPGYPTAMAMLPDYSMQQGPGGACGDGDYLAVAGGRSSFEGPPKYLWIIDVSDPTKPHRVTGAVITFSDTARINGMQWAPPFLGLLIAEGGITSLQVINVPEMVYGLSSTEAEIEAFPSSGGSGLDANRDGDYCDVEEGDLPPIPSKREDRLFGMVVTLSPPSPNERILDFAIDADSGVIGVVYYVPGATGGSGYRTLFAGLEPVDGNEARVSFGATDFPKRLLFLPGTPLEEEVNGETTIQFKNLGLVSISGSPNRLALLDLTQAKQPSLIHSISLPTGSGVPQSMQVRGDGLVVVATPSKLLLLNPAQLMKADTAEGHPAFIGQLASLGSNMKKYVADTSGMNITSSGGNSKVAVTSPQIQILSFPEEVGSVDDILALDDEDRAKLLLQGRESNFLVPAKLSSPAQSTNVTAATSFYVFVNAPGGFGSEIPMSLVSLNRSGKMLPNSANSEMPHFLVDQASYGTLTGTTNSTSSATGPGGPMGTTGGDSTFKTDFVVKRLSGPSQSSVFYNTYLGGPLVLTRRDLTAEDVTTLDSGTAGKRYLKAGQYLWAGIAPQGFSGSTAITNFLSKVDGTKLLPGTSSLFRVAKPRLPLILIHGVAGSHLEINSDAGGTDVITQLRAKVFSELWPGYHIFNNVLENISVPILPDIAQYVSYARLLSLEGVDLSMDEELTVVASDIIRQIPEAYNAFAQGGLTLGNGGSVALENVYAPLIDYITDELGYVEYRHMKLNDAGRLDTDSTGFKANEMHKLRVAPADDSDPDQSEGETNSRQNFDDYIRSQIENHPDFFVFVYDWRLSNVTSAKKLEAFLDLIKIFHPDLEKVDIVAHSMGGMVARRFIMNNPDKVDKLITLGTPFLGAPKTILTLETGQFLDSGLQHAIIISRKSMRQLAQFFPGPHQLVPASKYFELVPDTFVERGWDYNNSGNAYDTLGFGDFRSAFDTVRFANVASTPVDESGNFNDSSVTPTVEEGQQASPIHQSDWTNDPTDVNYYHIYGIQAVPRTIGKVAATRRIRPSLVDTGYFTFREELEVGYVLGDGTVPLVSASRMASGGDSAGTGGGSNAPNAIRIPLVATENTSDANKLVDHNGMNGNPKLHRIVGAILNEEFEQPTAGTSGTETVVTTVRIVNADRSSIKVLDENGEELPSRIMANLNVQAIDGDNGEGSQPAANIEVQREGVDDHYGVQLYEVDPFAVADSAGSIPARDDEEDEKSDVIEIVTYGEDFQIAFQQTDFPVSIRIEQERDGMVERLMIWNDLNEEDVDIPEETGNGLVPQARFVRRNLFGSLRDGIVKVFSGFGSKPEVILKPGEGAENVAAQNNEIPDSDLEGESARDTTAPTQLLCEAIDGNSKYQFRLTDNGTLLPAGNGQFYFYETDPATFDPEQTFKFKRVSSGGVIDILETIASAPGESIWVIGEDIQKNIGRFQPLEVPLLFLSWEPQGIPRFGENDWKGMIPFARPEISGITADLLEVKITMEPRDLARGKVTLSVDDSESRVKVYLDRTKMNELPMIPMVWELPSTEIPEVVFVEAQSYSESLDDVTLKLTYLDTSSNATQRKEIESRIILTIPKVELEPINNDGTIAANPSGIVMGRQKTFSLVVEPQGIPDESITWSSLEGHVSFVENSGREVLVQGDSEGVDQILVGIEGFEAPTPKIWVEVFESESVVDVEAYIVADTLQGEGEVIKPEEIPMLLEKVNRYYDHIGLRFKLAGAVTYLVSPDPMNASWKNVSITNNFAIPRQIWSSAKDTGGIEMYFVNSIDGGQILGLNHSPPEGFERPEEAGILVATAVQSPAVIAHELGHACGLADIYVDGTLGTRTFNFPADAAPREEWLPEDWGSSSSEFSYYNHMVTQFQLVKRLLMHGFIDAINPENVDIPSGPVQGMNRDNVQENVRVGIRGPGDFTIDRTPEH